MKKTLTAGMLALSLVVPAAAMADEGSADKRNAAKECKIERGSDDASRLVFAEKYGTNANKKNAFGKCVSQKTREERSERKAAKRTAKKECKAERSELGKDAFAEKYGTNRNKRNAFGKCVSKAARKAKRKEDAEDRQEAKQVRQEAIEQRSAAKECKEERDQLGAEAFAVKYGQNKNKKNAFGKCVSAKDQPENG